MSEKESEQGHVFEGFPLRCGCILHKDDDHSHVQGCPSIQLKRTLEEKELYKSKLIDIRDALDWLFSGVLDED